MLCLNRKVGEAVVIDLGPPHGPGDPDAPRHRKDDPATVSRMQTSRGA